MEFLTISIIIVGLILLVLAFIGCILPALPGPPFAFVSLILLKLTDSSFFSNEFLITMGIITVLIFLLDYILPLAGAKLFKASKKGIWFSIIGMIIGIFFFPPFGMILGLLIGAIAGELIDGKAKAEALKVGLASFLFSLLAIIIKLAFVATTSFYFIKSVYNYYI